MSAPNKWKLYGLPDDLTGKSFLDVGCWEGHRCVDAVLRGASNVVGVDLYTCDALHNNVEQYGFEFVQMDVLSEKFLELDRFDIVLCSGVLYHVENVLSLLIRLRKSVDELLVVETVTHHVCDEQPILLLHAERDLADNPSNWWTPNELCLKQMLEVSGFRDIKVVYRKERKKGTDRVCVHAIPAGSVPIGKILTRRKEYMSLYGGNREQRDVLLPGAR